jgi:hypothetical protein
MSIVDPFTAQDNVPHGLVVRPFEPRIGFDIAILRSAQVPLSMIAEDFLAGFLEEATRFRDNFFGIGGAGIAGQLVRGTEL